MTTDLPAPAVAAGAAPQVCARHGQPAARRRKVTFRSYTPKWTYVLLLFGLLPWAIVAAVLQKRVTAPAWPYCQECGRLRVRRLLIGVGLLVLAIVLTFVLAAVLPQDGSAAGPAVLVVVLLVIAGLGVASTAANAPLAAGHVSPDGTLVQFRRAHERFAEQARPLRVAPAGPHQPYPPGAVPYQPQQPYAGTPAPAPPQPPYEQR